MKLDVYLDELDRSACCQSMLKIEFLPTLVKFFKPLKTHPPPRPPARHSVPEGPLLGPQSLGETKVLTSLVHCWHGEAHEGVMHCWPGCRGQGFVHVSSGIV